MKLFERAESILTMISAANVVIMTGIGLIDGLTPAEVGLITFQIAALSGVCLYTHLCKPTAVQMKQPETEQVFKLEAHERTHEQKRHYQVALALMELGEQEKAVSYIDKIMQEIA